MKRNFRVYPLAERRFMTFGITHIVKKIKNRMDNLRYLRLIDASGFFDRTWYLTNNPDVANANVNPILHYLNYGGYEGRDPCPGFSSRHYLDTYAEARNSGMNPLIHYLKYGRLKGYAPLPQPVRTILPSSNIYKRPKVFCIGHNKTGTTSLESALASLGYKMGIQVKGAHLFDDWVKRDFRRIIEFCETAEAFQDIPFSLDFTYGILDYAFPGSKFILSVRSSPEEWYQSVISFHAKITGVKGIPSVDDLKNFPSPHGKGWLWRVQQHVYGVDETTHYDEKLYKAYYMNHNSHIMEYFKFRTNDLLVINLSDRSAMQSLCKFLNIEYTGQEMPHLNKSR